MAESINRRVTYLDDRLQSALQQETEAKGNNAKALQRSMLCFKHEMHGKAQRLF